MIRTVVIFANFGPYHLARAEALSEVQGIEAHFVELAPVQRLYPWTTTRDELHLPLTTLVDTPYEQTRFTKLLKELVTFLEELSPEAVVIPGYSPPLMLAAARWARMHDAASIMMFETTKLDHQRTWWKEQIKRWIVRRYYHAGFVGGKASHLYLSQLGMPSSYIWERYDVVSNDHFTISSREALEREAEHRERIPLPEHYFLYVGRFSEEKNLVRLLQAYRSYRDTDPGGWKLVMVGDGPQREELFETAKDLKLNDIVWPGFVQVEELPVYYALCGGFILPSVREPWGLVVNEAMACGSPVLVSERCGSASDLVVEGENGYTFDPFSSDIIAARMLKLSRLDNTEKRAMGEASQEIIKKYSPEVWAENLADCIRQTVLRVVS
jgi:1,2-diacylglycerol 3-alpha-glucosyltransferase